MRFRARLATATATTLKAGLLGGLTLWGALSFPRTFAEGPTTGRDARPVTVTDPRVISGKIRAEVTPQSSRNPLAVPPAFTLIEEVSTGSGSGSAATRTWKLVTADLKQTRWLSDHVGYPVVLIGRRGERSGDAYFFVESHRESQAK